MPLKTGGGGQIRTAEPEGADLQSAAFSHFATPPYNGGLGQNRTADTLSFNQVLYQLSYQAILKMVYFIRKPTVSTGIEPAIFCVTGRHVNPYTTRPFCNNGG